MDYQKYLDEYALSHANPVNVKLHNICVPLIVWSLLGFAHTFSLGDIHLSHILALMALVVYASFKNLKLLGIIAVSIALCFVSFEFTPHLRIVSLIVFVVAWVGQFYGHHVEGKKPSFLRDIFFLLIGPVWVIKKFFPTI